MCFVWIWEETAIISVHSINWLVCVTETVFTVRYGLRLYVKFRLVLFYKAVSVLSPPLHTISAEPAQLPRQNALRNEQANVYKILPNKHGSCNLCIAPYCRTAMPVYFHKVITGTSLTHLLHQMPFTNAEESLSSLRPECNAVQNQTLSFEL